MDLGHEGTFITDTAVISADAVTGLLAGNSLGSRVKHGSDSAEDTVTEGKIKMRLMKSARRAGGWVSLKRAGPSLNE